MQSVCCRSQREKQVICIANQNGSQSECDLGNPLKRDSEVRDTSSNAGAFCSSLVRPAELTTCLGFGSSKATFYIILSTAGISLDTTEISIGLLLQT